MALMPFSNAPALSGPPSKPQAKPDDGQRCLVLLFFLFFRAAGGPGVGSFIDCSELLVFSEEGCHVHSPCLEVVWGENGGSFVVKGRGRHIEGIA